MGNRQRQMLNQSCCSSDCQLMGQTRRRLNCNAVRTVLVDDGWMTPALYKEIFGRGFWSIAPPSFLIGHLAMPSANIGRTTSSLSPRSSARSARASPSFALSVNAASSSARRTITI